MPWLGVPLGLLTGLVMGALGGGGAILAIPVLIYVAGMPPHEATTASLVIVGVSAAVAATGPIRHGNAHVHDALVLAVVGIPGTYAGSLASAAVPAPILVVLLATLLAVVGALMTRHQHHDDADRQGADRPEAGAHSSGLERSGPHDPVAPRRAARRYFAVAGVGVGIGLLTGFFGVGGGFAIVPALTLALGVPIRAAIGTSLLVIALNSASALAVRLAHGITLDWPVVLLFTMGAVVGGLLGDRLARRLSPDSLQRGFAALLFLVATYMLAAAVVAH